MKGVVMTRYIHLNFVQFRNEGYHVQVLTYTLRFVDILNLVV